MPRKLTTEEFIAKAKERWGDRFDYSQTIYRKQKDPVVIICPDHGEQVVVPSYFLYGKDCCGCPECGGGVGKKLTTTGWIERAQKKWGERFNYSRVNYKNRNTRVVIGCPTHGWVEVLPQSHLLKREGNTGCPKCGKEERRPGKHKDGTPCNVTFEAFVKRARDKYGDRYVYDKKSYKGMAKSISFICSEHGKQEQIANNHLSNRSGNLGCRWCSKRAMGDMMRVPFAEFIKRAKKVHGELFDYSEERYFGLNNEAGIECKEHGVFWQSAKNHIDLAHGCSACSGKKQHTTETWVEKARLVHGDRYSYEKSIYTTAHMEVVITCPVHGDFTQVAGEHTNKGHGCAECGALLSGNDNLNAFENDSERASDECEIYVTTIKGFVKIGISKDAQRRDPLYEEFIYQRLTERANAWCVEQNILYSTRWAIPPTLPREFDNWSGASELRELDFMPIDELSELLDRELDICEEEGWRRYANRELLGNNFGSINLQK